MGLDAWFTLLVILVVIAALASERVSAPVAVLGGVTVLLVTGVIDSSQAFAGFSSEAPVTVAAMYVLAAAAESTGVLDRMTAAALGRPRAAPGQTRPRVRELLRLLLPASLLSSVVYNTPTVSVLGPQVSSWARRAGRPGSWYLLALNAAVLLGGLLTAVGTTTNVVVSGLLVQAGQAPLGLFELTPVALPVVVAGVAVLLLLTPLLAPTRRAPSAYDVDSRDFTLEMVVVEDGPLDGSAVGDAGLRNLDGVFLVELNRSGRSVAPVPPEEVMLGGDQLVFAGNVGRALDLQRTVGLASAEERHFTIVPSDRRFFEVVVASGSSLVGSTLKEADFRARFGAAVIAIHRSGERLGGKLGSIRLHAGDVLLVLAGAGFWTRCRQGSDFVALAGVGETLPLRRELAARVGLVFAAFVAVAASGLLDVVQAALLAAFAMLVLKVMTGAQARQAVDLNVVVTLAASFGLGAAMTSSGLAEQLASLLVSAIGGFGPTGVITAIVIATVVVTQLVTNNAAAIVMFPIALASGQAVGADVRTCALAVAIAASLSFMTPIGYQTNLIVQGLGGYRFVDFLPIGTVLAVVCGAVAVVALTG